LVQGWIDAKKYAFLGLKNKIAFFSWILDVQSWLVEAFLDPF